MNNLFLGIKGHVVCIDKRDGKELWRTKLRSDMSGVTTLMVEGDIVYAYTSGHLYCVDARSGEKRWENKLPGLGHGFGIMSSGNGAVSSMAATAASAAGVTAAVVAGSASASCGDGGC